MNQMKLPVSEDEAPDLSLFDQEVYEEVEPVKEKVTLTDEPLFSHFLRRAIHTHWPNDDVMRDFVEMVVPPISKLFAHVSAKGADFALGQLNEGLDAAKVARYLHDQSMRAHLVNGLLPALQVVRQPQRI